MTQHDTFHRIGLIARFGTYPVSETLHALQQYLLKLNKTIFIEKNTAEMMGLPLSYPAMEADKLHQHCDLLIVVGGDGSLLHAAHLAAQNNLPVLGINRGRLGFLTDIHPDDLHRVGQVVQGDYVEEKRFLLTVDIYQNQHKLETHRALNDVVLLHGDAAHMIEFEISINDQFVCRQLADGLICATPTGSTAYALSGGGPIMHPDIETLVLVPMFPHTLSNRPIVVSARDPIAITLTSAEQNTAFVSIDGMQRIDLSPEGHIHIHQQKQKLRLIHPSDYNYFTTLREKLGWQHYAQRANT